MGYVDLHLHSTASDGRLAPAEVVREVAARGLVGLALTDHDTVAGLQEASAEAARLGLAFLPGAELSSNEPGRSIHLLAYCFDGEEPGLAAFLREYRVDRERRAGRIVERLNDVGVPLDLEAVRREAGAGVPTRAHVARALVAEGLVGGTRAAFERYLARGRPAFVEKRPTPPEMVIGVVHAAGGVVLLAHPGRVHRAPEVRRWIRAGLDGIEILHPDNRLPTRRSMEALVHQHGLLRGGGSDWHGPDSERAELGSQRVPLRWMKEIAERAVKDADPSAED
ncbi:MAG: PHP domain-containing protein [Gemmatimonadota bacterium]